MKKSFWLVALLAMVLSASVSFADSNIDIGVSNDVTNINETNVNQQVDVNQDVYQNVEQQQQQDQQQEQKQDQAQKMNNNIKVERPFLNAPEVNYPGLPVVNLQENLRFNDLSTAKIENGISVFTSGTISRFYNGLPKGELKRLKNETEIVFYPGLPAPQSNGTGQCSFLHGKTPGGVEGRDYFLLGEFEINADPDDRHSLRVRGNAFKFLAAERGLSIGANAFTILSFGGDTEQRNGSWGAGLNIGGSTAGTSSAGSASAGLGISRGWAKQQSRPWAYGKFYYIRENVVSAPPPPPVYEEKIAYCTKPCEGNVNLRINEAIKQASDYLKTGSESSLRSARDILWIAIDRDGAKTNKKQLNLIYELLGAINLEFLRLAEAKGDMVAAEDFERNVQKYFGQYLKRSTATTLDEVISRRS